MKLPLLVGVLFARLCLATGSSHFQCKTMPGDPSWPDAAEWERFNASVDGRLIRTVPIASVCHGSGYDEEKCAVVKGQWHEPAFQ
jgi:hypothetical protein